MLQTDNNEAFLFVTPPLSEVWFYCFPNGTPSFNFWRFLTDHHIWCSLAEGAPYLVIALKSTRARPFWAPATNTKNHNWLDRLPSTTTSKTAKLLKFLILSSRTFKNFRKLKLSYQIPNFLKICQNFFDGGTSLLSKERKNLLFKDQTTKRKESKTVYQNILTIMEQNVSIQNN